MTKDKKKKSKDGAKVATKAAKKEKAEQKGRGKGKKLEALHKLMCGEDNDKDIDEVLEEYRRQQEQFLKITETVADGPPKPRAASTILASPSDCKHELLLFGGEYWNNALAQFYNDLHIYNVDRGEWRCVTSPNAPLPRSGHAWCRAGNQPHVYLFGGEFSSPKQGTFHHYSDFWLLDPASREWTKIESKGKAPPSRSGHRMTHWKHYIILFGGFQDTSNQTRYLADLWIFDTQNMVWHAPALPAAQLKPDARSSFTFLPHEQGAVLFGGYSRVKVTAGTGKQTQKSQKNKFRPMIHQDCFFLRMGPPPEGSVPGTAPTVRWEKRKKPANTPSPSRAGATMAWHKGRGIMFGGVHDVEESEDGMDSEFFNQLFAWNVERNRFFPLALRRPRVQKSAPNTTQQRVNRRGRAQANEEELLKHLAALETGKSIQEADTTELDRKENSERGEEAKPAREMVVSMELPRPRFNSQLAVLDDVLYIYGGTLEKGDREYTLDDLYAIDLGKMDGCKQIFQREADDWVASDDNEDDEEDEDDEDDDDEDEEMSDGSEEEPVKENPISPSKRGKKPNALESSTSTLSDDWSIVPTPMVESITSLLYEDIEIEEAAENDDGLPHPRPFESRRDFFARTSAEWQEILMTSLRWKGIQPETLTVKEIKTKAFELSEEKWWDCREDITALEEEQEAAGITEVVSLAERGEAGAGRRR